MTATASNTLPRYESTYSLSPEFGFLSSMNLLGVDL
jgi:hypothetical protein